MTKIKDICQFLEGIAPLHLQETYDNAGLITGTKHEEVTGILVSLDCTEAIIDEAIELKCNMVVSHHPIIFNGLKQLTGETYIERTIIKAIKHDIAIYAIHTNLDNVFQNGVNEKIAAKLGLKNPEILLKKDSEQNIGSGMIGFLANPMKTEDFFVELKSKMSLKTIRHTKKLGDTVHKIALCGGSGSFLLDTAIQAGADVFISADFKYHQFFDANDKLVIIDIGHYESEFFTIELLYKLLNEKFTTFAAHYTKLNTNPINYL